MVSDGLQVGNPGFAINFQTTRNLIFCGISVFLPHPLENQQKYSGLKIEVTLFEHGVEHSGPIGAPLTKIKTEVSKKDVIQWAGSKGCPRSKENKRRISLYCLQGQFSSFKEFSLSSICNIKSL